VRFLLAGVHCDLSAACHRLVIHLLGIIVKSIHKVEPVEHGSLLRTRLCDRRGVLSAVVSAAWRQSASVSNVRNDHQDAVWSYGSVYVLYRRHRGTPSNVYCMQTLLIGWLTFSVFVYYYTAKCRDSYEWIVFTANRSTDRHATWRVSWMDRKDLTWRDINTYIVIIIVIIIIGVLVAKSWGFVPLFNLCSKSLA